MGCKELSSSGGQRQHHNNNHHSDNYGLIYQLLLLLLILVLGARVAAAQTPFDNDDDDDDDDDYTKMDEGLILSSIVEGLGLRRIPDPAKANVSQAEYERAHKEYLTRLRRSAEGDSRQRRLFTTYATDKETREGIELSFPMAPEQSDNLLMESAALRMLLDHNEDSDTGNIEIRVYRKRPTSGARRRLLTKRTVEDPDSVRRRWLEFDLTDEVAAALALNSEEPLHLLIQVLRTDQLKDSSSLSTDFSISSAALNIHALYLEGNFRSKRSLGTSAREQMMSLHRGRRSECRGEAKKCCRHHMTVTFKDLEGFDFIVQPKNFDAGYCKGRCPPRYNPAHHHALLQSLIWKEDRKKAPRPCCAPSKLAELEILYFDENDTTKLKVSNWKDMRVLECACS